MREENSQQHEVDPEYHPTLLGNDTPQDEVQPSTPVYLGDTWT